MSLPNWGFRPAHVSPSCMSMTSGMCHGANTAFLELYRKGAGRWRANGSLRAATAIWGNQGHGTITEPETTRQALRGSRTTTNGKKIEVTGCDVFTFKG